MVHSLLLENAAIAGQPGQPNPLALSPEGER